MSGGPIDRARAAWKLDEVSTPNSKRVCLARTIYTTQCGRAPVRGKFTSNRDDATCADCLAAWNADHAVGGAV